MKSHKPNNIFQNKIDLINYIVSISLLIVHIVLLYFYIQHKIYPLIIISGLLSYTYLFYALKDIKNIKIFEYISYYGILTHCITGIICIGFDAGYYLWIYALICSYFLPSFTQLDNKITDRPIYIGIILAIIFYTMSFLCIKHLIAPVYTISKNDVNYLFSLNSLLVFLAITGCTCLYTSKIKIQEAFLKYKADNDLLTGLKNRRAINQIIDERISNHMTNFSIAIIDIDFFKKINDTYGHNAGDYILMKLADKLRKLEGYDIISSRWGGEEFLILSPNYMQYNDFIKILKDFITYIEEYTFVHNKKQIKLTISIGASQYNNHKKIQKAIEQADINLYRAKDEGRNRIIY